MPLFANRYRVHYFTAAAAVVFAFTVLLPPLFSQAVTYEKWRAELQASDAFQKVEIERLATAEIHLLELLETEHDLTSPKSKAALDEIRATLVQQKKRLQN
jgi:hypothetical protein